MTDPTLTNKKKFAGAVVVVVAGLAAGLLVGQVVSSAFWISVAAMFAFEVFDSAFNAHWGHGWSHGWASAGQEVTSSDD